MKLKASILILLCVLGWSICPAQNFDNYQKTWATYFGGTTTSFAYGATDSEGNIIAVGKTVPPLFAKSDENYYNQFVTSDDSQFHYHANDDTRTLSLIAKFSPEGDLLWSGYYPFETTSFAIDANDNIYLTAITQNSTLGTPGAWEEQPLDPLSEEDKTIMVKLHSDFTVEWLTYLPINSYPFMDIGRTGIFITGGTTVEEGITTDNVFQPDYLAGGPNGYIVKLDFQGQPLWATYCGRTYNVHINSSPHGVMVCSIKMEIGNSDYYYTDDAYQQTPSSRIIAIFNPETGQRLYSTYFDAHFSPTNIGFASGFYYLFGFTTGPLNDQNLISPDAFQSSAEDNSNFYLGKFDAQMNPIWGTYIGGNQHEQKLIDFGQIEIKDGGIYITGQSQSDEFFDSPNPYQLTNHGNGDLLFMKFSLDGDFIWGSFFGGSEIETAGAIVPISDDTFYLIGGTCSSTDISTLGAYQEHINKYPDTSPFLCYPNGFIAKFAPDLSIKKHTRHEISIYPNPTTGKVVIRGDFSGQNKVRVYNALGQKVFSKTAAPVTGTITLNLQYLSPGLYFIRLTQAGNKDSFITKLVVY